MLVRGECKTETDAKAHLPFLSCATCIRNNQGDYTNTNYDEYTTTTYYDNNGYDNNDDNNNDNYNYNQDYNNNNEYENNDDDDDNDNDYKKRAIPFGRPTPAPGSKKARSFKGKRGILDDLLNLDGLVCTVNGGRDHAPTIFGNDR